ncbi:SGNH/GDSL hydrolase family protein [Mucilaginibacter sp. FT3.2]|uniref:SGNH/GDSL hydrolase family protein n=1 Tax=Mucilaginibacter sp. FT3.2 TaxID=2723090 RepID=UPI00182049F8|nr:lysophospholipase L1-like esterase [Mucilaginibacter sp. FT3.2]
MKNIIKVIIISGLHLSAYGQGLTDTSKMKVTTVSVEEKEEDNKLHNDWANLKYYQDDNKKLGAGKKDLVLLIGDSITELWADTDPSFFKVNMNYIDRGISGQTTPQLLLRFRQDVINLKPKIVIILGGTNDIAGNTGPATIDEIFGNLVSMIELAKANHIKPVICSILPAIDYPWKRGLEPSGKIAHLNHKLKVYAAAHQITYLDYYNAMKDSEGGLKKNLTKDGVHPNITGYKIMEPLLQSAISQWRY